MADTLAGASQADSLPHEVFKISAGLSLLSEALHDPDVKVRAVLSYSPQPNPLQQEAFVRAYLDADRPADALTWLRGAWGTMEESRQGLLSDALGRLGRFDESAPIRQQMFERSLSVFDLQRWLEHLPEPRRAEATSRARQLALDHDDPTAAATLLLELGDAEAAETRLMAEPSRIDGNNYPALVPLAEGLRSNGCWRGETVVYRALLRGILGRPYAPAYGYAARYWARLREIAESGVSLMPLPPHEELEAEIRTRHARKTSFWAHVSASK
jgi:hypothetical protein